MSTQDAQPVLPPLPLAVAHIAIGDDTEDIYTADQMHAYARAAMIRALAAELAQAKTLRIFDTVAHNIMAAESLTLQGRFKAELAQARADVERLNLRLLSAEQGEAAAARAEALFRDAEALLTVNERKLVSEGATPQAEPVAIPKGWAIARNADGTIIASNDHMGCVVPHTETVDRKMPSEVLHALCADLLATTPPPVQPLLLFNGLTQAETEATASCAGLQAVQPQGELSDEQIMAIAEDIGVVGPRSRFGNLHNVITPFARAVLALASRAVQPMSEGQRHDLAATILTLSGRDSRRNLVLRAIDWTERQYGITQPQQEGTKP